MSSLPSHEAAIPPIIATMARNTQTLAAEELERLNASTHALPISLKADTIPISTVPIITRIIMALAERFVSIC